MNASTFVGRGRSRARLAFLTLSTALATGLTAPALAQTASPTPLHQLIDANGVDLFTGRMTADAPGVSMGRGEQGLVYRPLNRGGGWTDNIIAALTQSGTVVMVTLGGVTDSFTASGTTYTAVQGNGATLTFSSATNLYTYVRSDGTVVHFSNARSSPAPYNASLGRATDLTLPSGAKLVYAFDSLSYCSASKITNGELQCVQSGTAYRISTVNSSYGYRLTFAYQPLPDGYDPSDPNGKGVARRWSTLTGVAEANVSAGANAPTMSESFGYLPDAPNYTVTDPLGRLTSYRMTADGIAGVTRPGSSSEDLTATYTSGRVTNVSTPAGAWSYASSDLNGARTVTVTDPASQPTTYVFDIASQLMTSVTDALGHKTSWAYTPDGTGHVQRVTAPELESVEYGYDARGNVTSTTLHAKPGSGQQDIATSAAYLPTCTNAVTCNQPTSTTDANGATTTYAYDQTHGGVLTVTSPAPTTGAVQPQTRYGYTAYADALGGTVYRQTSSSACQTQASCAGTADEAKTTVNYGSVAANNLLPLSSSTGAGDGSLTATSTVTYDAVGNLTSIDGPLPGAADTMRYLYDAGRRPIETVSPDPDGAGPLPNRAVKTDYTTHDMVASVHAGTANADGSGFVSAQDVNTSYDAADRKVQDSVTAGGTTYGLTQYSYAANRLTCTAVRMNAAAYGSLPDACTATAPGSFGVDRITKVTGYDQVGRAIEIMSAFGTADAATEKTNFTTNGQVATVTDANGNVTSATYDGFDRPLRTCFQVTTQTACAGSPADYEQVTYDAPQSGSGNGLVTSRRLRDGQVLSYSYDALSRRTYDDNPNTTVAEVDVGYTYDLLGRMTSAGDQNGWHTDYGYDALGRVTSQTSNLATTGFQYDLAGRMTRQTWSDGFLVTYEYDATGAPTAVRENGGAALATFSYDGLGRRTGVSRGNGTSTSYGYDPASRLTSFGHDLADTSADLSTTFGYNPAGQIASRTSSNDAYSWTGGATGSGSYSVDGLNRYTAAAGVSPTYDARGNTTSAGGQTYGYNSRNQLFTTGGGGLWYRGPTGMLGQEPGVGNLDWVGSRLTTIQNGGTARRYVYAPGEDTPLVWYEGAGTSDKRWLHTDERGSVIAVSDASGNALAINKYDEYGQPASGNLGRFGYTGQQWIAGLGLWDYKARMYSPALGRFMQTDPIGYGDGLNWYNYVGGDPVNSIDPNGLDVIVFGPSSGGGVFGIQDTLRDLQRQQGFDRASRGNERGDNRADDVVATAPVNCGLHPTDTRCGGNAAAQLTSGAAPLSSIDYGKSPQNDQNAQPGDVVVTATRISSQRGGNNFKSSEYASLSNEEILKRYQSAEGQEKLKLQRELKARGLRNIIKRGGSIFLREFPSILIFPGQIKMIRCMANPNDEACKSA